MIISAMQIVRHDSFLGLHYRTHCRRLHSHLCRKREYFLLLTRTTNSITIFALPTCQLGQMAREGLDHTIQKANPGQPSDTMTAVMDNLQWQLKCCGARETSDWGKYHGQYYSRFYPKSCCFDPLDSNQGRECGSPGTEPFRKPCVNALDDFLKVFLGICAAFILIVAIIQMVAACFACSISNAKRS